MRGATNIALTALACSLLAIIVSGVALYAISVKSKDQMQQELKRIEQDKQTASALKSLTEVLKGLK